METDNKTRLVAILIMVAAPAFFSTNLVLGRYAAPEVSPFILSFMRWSSVAIILFPFAAAKNFQPMLKAIREHWIFFLILGFLGMGISGGGVYLGLQSTTATNATLIYSTAPVLIILLERIFAGRQSKVREIVGIAIAFFGVAIIVLRGEFSALVNLQLNPGDILILLASLSWAGYSILYKSERLNHLNSLTLFAVIAIFGALINLPMAIYEVYAGARLPQSDAAWLAVLGIVFISSLLAFSAFQYGVRTLGASIAGMFMYLMTPYGVLMAVIFLGEDLQLFHFVGIVCVMVGIGAATLPTSMIQWLRRLSA